MTAPDFEMRLQAKLGGHVVRQNLARAGLVLATHEFVKAQVVDGVPDFFVTLGRGHDRYEVHVLDRAPDSTFEASCLRWGPSATATTSC